MKNKAIVRWYVWTGVIALTIFMLLWATPQIIFWVVTIVKEFLPGKATGVFDGSGIMFFFVAMTLLSVFMTIYIIVLGLAFKRAYVITSERVIFYDNILYRRFISLYPNQYIGRKALVKRNGSGHLLFYHERARPSGFYNLPNVKETQQALERLIAETKKTV